MSPMFEEELHCREDSDRVPLTPGAAIYVSHRYMLIFPQFAASVFLLPICSPCSVPTPCISLPACALNSHFYCLATKASLLMCLSNNLHG